MCCLKFFVMTGIITAFSANLAWAGSVNVVDVTEDRNALVAVTLCGEEATIDDSKAVSEDDTFYILFSATEVEDEDCEPIEQSIAVSPCSEYSKIVALLYSEITPVPEGDIYKDLSVDSLDVELGINIEGCCLGKYEACIAKCAEGDAECDERCDVEYATCLDPQAEPETTVDCDPDTLNLKSNGNFVTCYLSSISGNGVEDIDPTSLYLHYADLDANVTTSLPALLSNIEEDELMVKFSRPNLIQAIDAAKVPMDIELIISGDQDLGSSFEAADTITAIKPPNFNTYLSGQTVILTVMDLDDSVVNGTIFWGDRGREEVTRSQLSGGVEHMYNAMSKHGYKIRVQLADNNGVKTNYTPNKDNNLNLIIQ
jgi:hypothetical protein